MKSLEFFKFVRIMLEKIEEDTRSIIGLEGVNPSIYYIYCKKECLLIREIDKYKYMFF